MAAEAGARTGGGKASLPAGDAGSGESDKAADYRKLYGADEPSRRLEGQRGGAGDQAESHQKASEHPGTKKHSIRKTEWIAQLK